jgi:hypothetical protein
MFKEANNAPIVVHDRIKAAEIVDISDLVLHHGI